MKDKKSSLLGSKLNIVLLVIFVILVIYVFWLLHNKKDTKQEILPSQQSLNSQTSITKSTSKPSDSTQVKSVAQLLAFSLTSDQEVSGKLTVSGAVNGGYFFEGNIGVNILDAQNKLLRQGHGTATTNWMTQGAVQFTADLDFTGLPKGRAYIEIHNDNASGLPQNDKSILFPIRIN